MSGPRADFVCFRCEEKEAGSGGPFRDLPLSKPICPNCGARKWMQRQWSGYSPMVSTNGDRQKFKIADANVEGQMLAHENARREAHASEMHARRAESVVPGIDMRVRAIQPSQVGNVVRPFGGAMATSTGKAELSLERGAMVERATDGAAATLAGARRLRDPDPGDTRQKAMSA